MLLQNGSMKANAFFHHKFIECLKWVSIMYYATMILTLASDWSTPSKSPNSCFSGKYSSSPNRCTCVSNVKSMMKTVLLARTAACTCICQYVFIIHMYIWSIQKGDRLIIFYAKNIIKKINAARICFVWWTKLGWISMCAKTEWRIRPDVRRHPFYSPMKEFSSRRIYA